MPLILLIAAICAVLKAFGVILVAVSWWWFSPLFAYIAIAVILSFIFDGSLLESIGDIFGFLIIAIVFIVTAIPRLCIYIGSWGRSGN